jgi:hypothetical protein
MSDEAMELDGFFITNETLTQESVVWESRVPGESCDSTWDEGSHEHVTLTEATTRVLPFYAEYGLSLVQAAHLALRTGLVVETGISVEEWRCGTEIEDAWEVAGDAPEDRPVTDDPGGR